METREQRIQRELRELNEEFKTLETYEELIEFEKKLDTYGEGYFLKMKRSGYQAYHFSHLYDENVFMNRNPYANDPDYKNKVQYLISDSVSVGKSFVKNLHRNIKVADR